MGRRQQLDWGGVGGLVDFFGRVGFGGCVVASAIPTHTHTRTHAYTHTQQRTDLLLPLHVVQGHSQLLALVGERLHDPLLAPAVAAVVFVFVFVFVFFFFKLILGVGRES